MKRELSSSKRSSNSDVSKRLTFIKKSFHPTSLQSSTSSSIISNAEAKQENSKIVKSGCIHHDNDTSSQNNKQSKLTKFRENPVKIKNEVPARSKGIKRGDGKGEYKDDDDDECYEYTNTTPEVNQEKFSSPWVLSGDAANMRKTAVPSKLPTKLISSKLNRSRSNLSGRKSPHQKSSLRRSVSRSHSKLSGSRKNMVPPAPPVRTISLKNNRSTNLSKQTNGPHKSNSNIPVHKQGSDPNEKRLQNVPDKKCSSMVEASRPRQRKNLERNKEYRYSEEIEANLNYVNIVAKQTQDCKDLLLQPPKNISETEQRKLQNDLKRTIEQSNKQTIDKSNKQTIYKSQEFKFDSSDRKLGSKFNYVIRKTGFIERRDSKVESNEYVTMETIRKLKNNLNQPQQQFHSSDNSNNSFNDDRDIITLKRLNSETVESNHAYSNSLLMNNSYGQHFVRSRLGSVPTLPMNVSITSDQSVHQSKQINPSKRSVAGVCEALRSSSTLAIPTHGPATLTHGPTIPPYNYSTNSLRLSQHSAFTPLFNPVEHDLARMRSLSESQNRTLNGLHLLPFQDHASSRRRSLISRLSHSSLSSDRSFRSSSSSSFLVPLGKSTKEVQDLQKELEHAQSRINNLTSQLTSNVQVVASFEQNLEKMLKRLHSMNARDSNESNSKDSSSSEHVCDRISKSCEDLLESKRGDSSHKKAGRKNWFMSSISKAFLRNKNKTNVENFQTEQQTGNVYVESESTYPSGDEHSKVKQNEHTNEKEQFQPNARAKSKKSSEITVKQFIKKSEVYKLFVVIKRDNGAVEENNPCKVLAGNIEITNKTSWQEFDAKVQICFEEHLKKLDEECLDLSSESIFNFNVGGLWRSIGDVTPEFLPCGYLVGACDAIFLHLKGLNEKQLDEIAYESLHRKNVLIKLSRLISTHGRLLIISRPVINESSIIKRISNHFVELSDHTEIIDARGRQSIESIKSFSIKCQSNKFNTDELLILKNVDKLIDKKINNEMLNVFHDPRLRVISEAEVMKNSMVGILSNFHCWVWPEEFKTFLKRHLKRKLYIEDQLSIHKSDENNDSLVRWFCMFVDKLSELGIPGIKRDLKQLITSSPERFQTWFTNFWLTDLLPKYFSNQSQCKEFKQFNEWVESSWPFKLIK